MKTERAAEDESKMVAAASAAATDIVTALRWNALPAYGTPCSDRSVLCADATSWFAGWWDADDATWRDCMSGAPADGVTHWAEPAVPQPAPSAQGVIDWTLQTR